MNPWLKDVNKELPLPPKHYRRQYKHHVWYRNEEGDIDYMASCWDYHNGPACKRCGYSFCKHCDPNGWDKEPCIVEYNMCPRCEHKVGRYSDKRYCGNCGQRLKWPKKPKKKES